MRQLILQITSAIEVSREDVARFSGEDEETCKAYLEQLVQEGSLNKIQGTEVYRKAGL